MLRARLGDSPAYLSGNPRVRFCVRYENVCFPAPAPLSSLYLIVSFIAPREGLRGRVFFRPLALFRSSAGASVEGGIDLRRGLAQNFLTPRLRLSGCVGWPSQQRDQVIVKIRNK